MLPGELFRSMEQHLGMVKHAVQLDPLVLRSQDGQRESKLTLGVTLRGCIVASVSPGGPAFLSRQISRGDRIVSVDDRPAMDNTVEEMLLPSDIDDGSICHLKVLKSASSGVGREGELVEVRLRRAREDVLSEVTKTFDLLGDITAHAAHLGDDAKMTRYVDELGKLVLRSMLDGHDRNVMVSRQHSAKAMECIEAIAAAKEAATQLLECKGSADAMQWQQEKEKLLRLGEEQKRLIKALEQQLDYAQEKNAELSQRLIKEQNSVKDIEQSVRRDIVHKEMNSANVRLAEFEAALSETGKALQLEKQETARLTASNKETMALLEDVRMESSKREEDVKRLLSQLQAADTIAKANTDEQVRIAKEHAEKQIELVKKTAEEDLKALRDSNELDLRSSRENALHEIRAVSDRAAQEKISFGKEKETLESIIQTLNVQVDTLQGSLKVERKGFDAELSEVQAQFNSEMHRLKRRAEDANETIILEQNRVRELAAQCAWLEELVVTKAKQVLELSRQLGEGRRGQGEDANYAARVQVEAEVVQVREAIAVRENQIRRLEQELATSGDPAVRNQQKEDIERAKSEVWEARNEILSLEKELHRGIKPKSSENDTHYRPSNAQPLGGNDFGASDSRGHFANHSPQAAYPQEVQYGGRGKSQVFRAGDSRSSPRKSQGNNITPLQALQKLRDQERATPHRF